MNEIPWWRRREDGSYWYHNPHRRHWRDKATGHKWRFGSRRPYGCSFKPHFMPNRPLKVRDTWEDMDGNTHQACRIRYKEGDDWWRKGPLTRSDYVKGSLFTPRHKEDC